MTTELSKDDREAFREEVSKGFSTIEANLNALRALKSKDPTVIYLHNVCITLTQVLGATIGATIFSAEVEAEKENEQSPIIES